MICYTRVVYSIIITWSGAVPRSPRAPRITLCWAVPFGAVIVAALPSWFVQTPSSIAIGADSPVQLLACVRNTEPRPSPRAKPSAFASNVLQLPSWARPRIFAKPIQIAAWLILLVSL